MNKCDIEFLNNLKKEMLTQSNRSTRNVMFAIQEKEIDYGYDYGYAEDYAIVNNGESYTLESFQQYLVDNEYFESMKEIENMDMDSLCDYVNEHFDMSAEVVGIKENEVFKLNNGEAIFFTAKACEEYIKRQGHHHDKPVSFGISAWNNSEITTLQEIITKTDWDKALDTKKALEHNNIKMLLDFIEYRGTSLTKVQNEILTELVRDSAEHFDFEQIANMSEVFAEFAFYTALNELDLLDEYFDKIDLKTKYETIINWISEHETLNNDYQDYIELASEEDIPDITYEFLMGHTQALEDFLIHYFKIKP